MTQHRVVVTGIGLNSPIGNCLDEVSEALRNCRNGIRVMQEWDAIGDLETRLGGVVTGVDLDYPRKKVRTMGRVGLLSLHATEQAIDSAGIQRESLSSGRVGVSYGSTHGSSQALEGFTSKLVNNQSLRGLTPSTYIKFMSHTCAANLALFYGIRGRIITTCSACTSASQGIGYGYESIANGLQDAMICGGAEEMHFMHAGVFDLLYATSTGFNSEPELSPRPFDRDRDGLVVAEGACTFILENFERAKKRGAHILAEILGFGTSCDGAHITSPTVDGMASAMLLALEDAQVSPDEIEYVNGHATATEVGDICESKATMRVLGADTPISSTKGFTGHTLGACGSLEAAFCVAMIRDKFLAPNLKLDEVDERCAKLDYIIAEPRVAEPSIVMTNNFAFGGVNTSIILKRM